MKGTEQGCSQVADSEKGRPEPLRGEKMAIIRRNHHARMLRFNFRSRYEKLRLRRRIGSVVTEGKSNKWANQGGSSQADNLEMMLDLQI